MRSMQGRRIWLYRGAQAGVFALTTGAGALGLAQQPFVAPLVERSAESAARAVEAAFHRTFTPGWVARELAAALAADQTDRALWLADLAQAEGVALDPVQGAEVARLRAEADSWLQSTADCAYCALDVRSCRSVAAIALCALPVELTPAGDLNALRRQGMAALAGQPVDRLETGLALVGLGATAAVVASGGGSAALKAGATAARMAGRLGTLSPGMTRALAEVADLPVNWGAVARGAPVEEITDVAKLGRLADMAGDLGRVASRAGPAETLVLLRHIDGPEDAARMARLADAAGARTLDRVEVLGKARAFRALMRVSDLALATLAALYAAALQVALMLAGGVARGALRLLRP